jgi:siroheme synthase-like protein
MPFFPLFISLEGKRCVIVGGGAVAARKAKVLAEFGAALTVIAPDFSPELRSLEGASLCRRPYRGPPDLAGAALVLAASGDRELNRLVAAHAGAGGIPVNVADDPGLCGFFFPALVRRGNAVAGISSSGGCPRLVDVQWQTDHLASLGVIEISRRAYLGRLAGVIDQPRPPWPAPPA